MQYIIPILFLILYNFTIVMIFNKKFGSCIPITFILSTLILYISQILFKTFIIGYIVDILISLYSIFIIIYKLIKKEDIKEILSNCFSKGFYIFIFISIFFTIHDICRSFIQWDEFSHWGVMVKEMIHLDKFYSVDESTLMVHKDYPPFASLFELLWCKLAGTYREDLLIQAIHIFEFSLFIPAYNEIKKIKFSSLIKEFISIVLVFILVILFDVSHIVNTIYIDLFMMILFAYTFSLVANSKDLKSNFMLFKLSLSLIALLLTKQMGLPLSLIVIFYYFVTLLFNKSKKEILDKKILLKIFIIIVIVPLIAYKSWSIFTNYLNIKGQFNVSDINVNSIKDIIKNSGSYRYKTLSNFVYFLFNEPISFNKINISFISAIGLILLILLLINHFYKKEFNDKKTFITGISFIIGIMGYVLVMIMLYLFCFSEDEALRLASYNRYMSSFIIGILSILIMIITNLEESKLKSKFDFKKIILILSFLTFVITIPNLDSLVPGFIKKNKVNIKYFDQASYLMKNLPKEAKVFIVINDIEELKNIYYIKYYANPMITNVENGKPFIVPLKDEYDKFNMNNFIKELSKYEYVYILNYEEQFIDKFNNLFENINYIENNSIYKIEINNEILKLKKIK